MWKKCLELWDIQNQQPSSQGPLLLMPVLIPGALGTSLRVMIVFTRFSNDSLCFAFQIYHCLGHLIIPGKTILLVLSNGLMRMVARQIQWKLMTMDNKD